MRELGASLVKLRRFQELHTRDLFTLRTTGDVDRLIETFVTDSEGRKPIGVS
jgi:hypothetical protein